MPKEKQSKLALVNSWIKNHPDLKFDGYCVECAVCETRITHLQKSTIEKHVNSIKHKSLVSGYVPSWQFNYDLAMLFISCNIPWDQLNNPVFQHFLTKYCVGQNIPDESTLRKNYLNKIYDNHITQLRDSMKDTNLWISIDETTDSRGRNIINVIARNLSPQTPCKSHLIASKIVEQTNSETIVNSVKNALQFLWQDAVDVNVNRFLLLVTDAAAYMKKASRELKLIYPNLIHVTCLAHALNRVADQVRHEYNDVNILMTNVKKIFSKAPTRVEYFKQQLPIVPLPPEPVLNRWGTWIEAALYYEKYFEEIKNIVFSFDDQEAIIINAKQTFYSPNIKEDFFLIKTCFSMLSKSIRKLETSTLSLKESIEIMDEVKRNFEAFSDVKVAIKMKLESELQNNTGLDILKQINNSIINGAQCEVLSDLELMDSYRFAQLTFVDVERSLSSLKWIFDPKRKRLTAENLEKMLSVYYESQDHMDGSDSFDAKNENF